jgi:DNA-binding SARP family transcriptional activator
VPLGRTHTEAISPDLRLTLLDGFELTSDGEPVVLAASQQRLVALLALQRRPRSRVHVAALLWLEANEARAGANLRSVLWRLNGLRAGIIDAAGTSIALATAVSVDTRELVAAAHRVVADTAERDSARLRVLDGELLPGWYDDWVLIEREQLRQVRLHALELLAERLVADGRYAAALETGLTAVRADPLRESAHRLLIRAYLAEGNSGDALRHFRLYRRIVRDKLGLEPSPQMLQLVRPLRPAVVSTAGDAAVTLTVTRRPRSGRTLKLEPTITTAADERTFIARAAHSSLGRTAHA